MENIVRRVYVPKAEYESLLLKRLLYFSADEPEVSLNPVYN